MASGMGFDGIAIGGYRSFGAPQRLAPLSKVNLIVGQNNSGKSNVLRFLHDRLPGELEGRSGSLDPLDVPSPHRGPFSFGLAVAREHLLKEFRPLAPAGTNTGEALVGVLDELDDGRGRAWFHFSAAHERPNGALRPLPTLPAGDPMSHFLRLLAQAFGGPTGDRWITEQDVLATLVSSFTGFGPVALVPAMRRIGTGSANAMLDGDDLVHRLAELRDPAAHELHHLDQFDAVERFARTVLDASDATLTVPYQRDTIQVQLDGVRRPLESLGTGISETLMLAIYCTVHSDQIVCIEEPELHLHPVLQQKLLRDLASETTNTYFITTHSAHILGLPGASIFHVRPGADGATIETVTSSTQMVRICDDLGYRPADLIQANCLIWVEGPSDRIYLNWWLNAVEPAFIEGVHYSVMFYGGRLLSHLTADDEEINEFIALRKINQHLAILIDSDKSEESEEISDTKLRVRNEFGAGSAPAWVTDGREVENYLPFAQITSAIEAVHPSAKSTGKDGRFESTLPMTSKKDTHTVADKVKVARWITTHCVPDLEILDLRTRIDALVTFIREANG